MGISQCALRAPRCGACRRPWSRSGHCPGGRPQPGSRQDAPSGGRLPDLQEFRGKSPRWLPSPDSLSIQAPRGFTTHARARSGGPLPAYKRGLLAAMLLHQKPSVRVRTRLPARRKSPVLMARGDRLIQAPLHSDEETEANPGARALSQEGETLPRGRGARAGGPGGCQRGAKTQEAGG